jgi:hypothetical protein
MDIMEKKYLRYLLIYLSILFLIFIILVISFYYKKKTFDKFDYMSKDRDIFTSLEIFVKEFRNDFPEGDYFWDKSGKIYTLQFNKTVQEDQAKILLEKYKMLFNKKDINVDVKLLFSTNGEKNLVNGIEIRLKN